MSAYDTPGSHENVPEVGWDWEPDLIEAIAHLVWKSGNHRTPFEGWYYKPQWIEIACKILDLVDAHRNVDVHRNLNTASLQALHALQCRGVADVEYGRELRCNLEEGHDGECKL